jgi:6,7-dimethyl-8-ribityllumazine synthase
VSEAGEPGAAESAAAVATPEHAAAELRVPSALRTFTGRPNGARRSIGIVVSRFNGEITQKLLDGALEALDELGVAPEAIEVMPVPGAFELPLGAMALARSRRYSAVIALGCVIRGDTPHFEYVSSEAASGIQLAALETGVPVSFGVLTCDTSAQALARAGGEHGNKGGEAARSALEMVESLAQLRSATSS